MSDSKSSVVALVPIDSLDRAILNLSARMDAACYEQLVLIRQFDERGGWLKWAFTNCTKWLALRPEPDRCARKGASCTCIEDAARHFGSFC